MRVLVVYGHPVETSFLSALHARVVETLRARGHDVDDLDLYAERFDPVLSRNQLTNYVRVDANTFEVEIYVTRLRAAEALVLIYPVWYDGLPAIMQGYFQRVFLPGVSTVIDENGLFHPNLQRIRRIGAVCTYGEPRREAAAKGDPARRFVRDNIGALIDPKGPFQYLALYRMDFMSANRREAFLNWVTRVFAAWYAPPLPAARGGSTDHIDEALPCEGNPRAPPPLPGGL